MNPQAKSFRRNEESVAVALDVGPETGPAPASRRRRWLQIATGVMVTIALLVSVQRVTSAAVLSVALLREWQQLFLAAFSFRIAFSVLLAVRTRITLTFANVRMEWWPLFWMTCAGHIPNLLVPAGLGGDLVRFAAIERDSAQPPGLIVRVLLLDRLLGLLALILLGMALSGAAYVEHLAPAIPATWWLGLAATVALSVLALYIMARLVIPRLPRLTWLAQPRPVKVILAVGTGLAGHLALLASGAVLFEAAGVHLPWSVRLQALTVVAVVASFPIAIGGHGLREASLVLLLGNLSSWSLAPMPAPAAGTAAQLALLLLVFHILSHLTLGSLAWAVRFLGASKRNQTVWT